MNLKWFRENGAWVLRCGYQTDDGATLWAETGYTIHKQPGAYVCTWPGFHFSPWHPSLVLAKKATMRQSRAKLI
jgi:hypothetical protein